MAGIPKYLSSAIISFLGMALSTFGASHTWDGGGSDEFWKTPENWSSDTVPGSSDGVTFGSSFTSGLTVRLDSNLTIDNITIDTSAGLVISDNRLGIASGTLSRTGSSSGDQTISADIRLGADALWDVAGSGSLTVSGVISDGAATYGLQKAGSGTLILSGINSYGGETLISQGVLSIRADRGLGATSGDTSVANGAALELEGGVSVAGAEVLTSLAGSGIGGSGALRSVSGDNTWGGDVTLSSSSTIAAEGGTLTISGDIDLGGNALTLIGSGDTLLSRPVIGTGSLVKNGDGTVTLSGNSTFEGSLVLNDGTFATGSNNRITDTVAVSVGGGAVFDLSLSTAETIGSIDGTGGVVLGAGTLTIGANDDSTSFSGVISGPGGITKTGNGTLTFTEANTYDGSTTVSSGVLNVQDESAFGSTASGVVIADGGALEIGNNLVIPAGEDITSIRGSGIGGAGALRNVSGANVWSGNVTVTGSGATMVADAGSLSIEGTVTLGSGRPLTLAGAGNMELGGAVSGAGTSPITKDGAGNLTLSGASTFRGDLSINDGSVTINDNTALGNTSGDTTVSSGATLNIENGISVGAGEQLTIGGTGFGGGGALRNVSGNNTWNGGITLSSGASIVADSGLLSLAGNVTLGANTLNLAGDGQITLSGSVSGSGGLTQSGSGEMTLNGSAANTFSGETTISDGTLLLQKAPGTDAIASSTVNLNGGTLLLGADNQIGDAVNLILAGGSFETDGNDETLGSLTLSADSTIDLGAGIDSILEFASASYSGGVLAIENWSGNMDGTGERIQFGTPLSPSVLDNIQFSGHPPGATQIFTGGKYVIVPVPEPATILSLAAVAALIVFRERRMIAAVGLVSRRWITARWRLGRSGAPPPLIAARPFPHIVTPSAPSPDRRQTTPTPPPTSGRIHSVPAPA